MSTARVSSPPRLGSGVPVEAVTASSFTVPTDDPESDGTLRWRSTTLVLVEARAGGETGLGFSYTHASAAGLIRDQLAGIVEGSDAMAVPGIWNAMVRSLRNLGRPGLGAMAIAAVDVSLWDLKARLLGVPLVVLLGGVRGEVPVYGSGGFTSHSGPELRDRLDRWTRSGIRQVKIKVGRDPGEDLTRVRNARAAIGADGELRVDANGAYSRKRALDQAYRFREEDVVWFEEPVSSDDLEGLRLLRDRAPPGMEIAAGEYGHDLVYFRRMLEAGAVDVLMPDATRCGGITGFLEAGALAEAFGIPVSAHTAPYLHLHPACALRSVRSVEYFFDHVRIEQAFFDGAVEPVGGALRPDLSRPGMGLEFRRPDAEKYRDR